MEQSKQSETVTTANVSKNKHHVKHHILGFNQLNQFGIKVCLKPLADTTTLTCRHEVGYEDQGMRYATRTKA